MKTGQCECAAVRYRSKGPWRDIIACHCDQCRRTSGHFWAATAVPTEALEVTEDRGLVWFASSGVAKRGFCKHCGSSLFYRHSKKSYTAVAAGSLDRATGLRLVEEVFCHEKGDYYPLSKGVKHTKAWSEAWKGDPNG